MFVNKSSEGRMKDLSAWLSARNKYSETGTDDRHCLSPACFHQESWTGLPCCLTNPPASAGAAAAGVRVMLGLQRGGGEHGGRQSSQGAVPREGVPRESVLLQLKETKRVEGKEVSGTDSIDSSVSGATHR